jgi:hypothetical protein
MMIGSKRASIEIESPYIKDEEYECMKTGREARRGQMHNLGSSGEGTSYDPK